MARDFYFLDGLENEYNLKDLKKYSKYIEDYIKEARNNLNKVIDQANKAIQVQWKYEVCIEKEKNWYGDKKVYYTVTLRHKPIVNNLNAKNELKHVKRFGGREKKDALKYANDLAKEYRTELIKIRI